MNLKHEKTMFACSRARTMPFVVLLAAFAHHAALAQAKGSVASEQKATPTLLPALQKYARKLPVAFDAIRL